MSYLRIVRYGQPIDYSLFVDEGPNTGRIHPSRLGIRGGLGNPVVFGAFPVGANAADRNREHQATYRAKRRAAK